MHQTFQRYGLLRVRSALPALRSLSFDPAAPTPLRLAARYAAGKADRPPDSVLDPPLAQKKWPADEILTNFGLTTPSICWAKCYSTPIADGTSERTFGPIVGDDLTNKHSNTQHQIDMSLFPAFYIIAYDLHKPEKSYPKLEAKMALFRDRFRILESTWLVKTKRDSTEIFKFLDSALDDDDHIFVTKFDLSSCDGRLSLDARIWLGKKNVGL